MKAILIAFATALATVASPAATRSRAASLPVEVMILGTYHMANPGRDRVNMKADDVTTPKRQAEIKAVTDALAGWRPTKVVVEVQAPPPSLTLPYYRSFTPDSLTKSPNEIAQIGFRLARLLGHQDVYGFDERARPGEPDYFPYGRVQAWAVAHGRGGELEELTNASRKSSAEEEQALARQSIAEFLLRFNDPTRDRLDSAGAFALMKFGDAEDQVGAELNAYWYMRNAKMFAKIALIAQPGDRILVVVGAGHRYWLTQILETTPGFVSADPRPYLRRAARQSRR